MNAEKYVCDDCGFSTEDVLFTETNEYCYDCVISDILETLDFELSFDGNELKAYSEFDYVNLRQYAIAMSHYSESDIAREIKLGDAVIEHVVELIESFPFTIKKSSFSFDLSSISVVIECEIKLKNKLTRTLTLNNRSFKVVFPSSSDFYFAVRAKDENDKDIVNFYY